MNRRILLSLVAMALVATFAAPVVGQSNPAVKSANDDIRAGLAGQDPERVERGVKSLVNVNTEESFKTLIKYLNPATQTGQEYYWLIVKGLAAFTGEESIAELGKFLIRNARQPLARDILFWIQSNYSPSLVPLLMELIERGSVPDDLKLMAIDHLGTLGRKESVDPLIELWKSVDGRRGKEEYVRRISRALAGITGESFGENFANWNGWWDRNKSTFLAGGGGDDPAAGGGGGGGGTVVERLDRGRKREYETIITGGGKHKVLVIKGADDPKGFDPNYDNIEQILGKMDVPHDVMTKQEAENDKIDFSQYAAILVNCNHFRERCVNPNHGPGGAGGLRAQMCVGPGAHQPWSDEFSPKAIDKIKNYVNRGGFLFTEDWVLEELLEKAWPDFVKHGDYMAEDKTVGVTPEPGATSHPYIQRLFAAVPQAPPGGGDGGSFAPTYQEIKHEWKIDKDSPKILIQDERRVQVLMQSDELVDDPKSTKDRAVAVTFRPSGRGAAITGGGGSSGAVGNGMVLHTLSHFGKQKSGEDEFALQNLLMNFLLEAFRAYQPGGGGRRR